MERLDQGEGTTAGYEITDGHCVYTIRKEKTYTKPARRWRDELDDYWKGTIWQRITQHRQMWKQHAEAFTQPRSTMVAQ